MKVQDVMKKNPITVRDNATYEEAAKVLTRNNFSGVPVVSGKGKLVGIISEKDLFRAVFPNYSVYYAAPGSMFDYEAREKTVREVRNQPVEKFMSRKLWTIKTSDPILKAGALMLAKGVFRLPVLEKEKLVGIVTREHIYKAIFKKYLKL